MWAKKLWLWISQLKVKGKRQTHYPVPSNAKVNKGAREMLGADMGFLCACDGAVESVEYSGD